jgi:hypothetical protein
MRTIWLKLPERRLALLEKESRARRTTKSSVARECLGRQLPPGERPSSGAATLQDPQLSPTLEMLRPRGFRYSLRPGTGALRKRTIPDERHSRPQKYPLTDKGRAWLAVLTQG